MPDSHARNGHDAPESEVTLADRIGPISFLTRLATLGILGWFSYVLVAQIGLDTFSQNNTVAQPYLWVLIVLELIAMYAFGRNYGGGPRAGRHTVAALVGLAGVAALVSLAFSGAVWAAPLTWLIYGLWFGIFATATLLGVAALILRTPGCETAAIRELVARRRGKQTHQEMDWCEGGFHRLDAWEIRRRHRNRASPD